MTHIITTTTFDDTWTRYSIHLADWGATCNGVQLTPFGLAYEYNFTIEEDAIMFKLKFGGKYTCNLDRMKENK
jgi:hypothetical protein